MKLRFALLLACSSLLEAQNLSLRQIASMPLATPLPGAFRLVSADLNGDGLPDFVIGTNAGLTILASGSSVRLQPGATLPVPAACPRPQPALADFDSDGFIDLAVYCPQAGLLLVRKGNGDATFSPPSSLILSQRSANGMGILSADFDGNGTADLVLGQDGKLAVLLGQGDGTFQPAPDLVIRTSGPDPSRPIAIVTGDFNADGIPDLAAVNLVYDDNLSVFLGTGGGQFETVRNTGLCRPHDVVAVDYDSDGTTDLAVACDEGVFLYRGAGDGAFTSGFKFSTQDRPLSIATADLNGDGIPDFVAGNYYNGRASVLISDGSTLREQATIPALGDVYAVMLLDVNGDSLLDLVATSFSSSSLLWSAGAGNGDFEAPSYLGTSPTNAAWLRTEASNLAVIQPGSRAVTVWNTASQSSTTVDRRDYPIDGLLADFNGDGIADLALVTVPDWRGKPGGDFQASLRILPGNADGSFGDEIATPIPRSPSSQGFGSLDSRFLSIASGDFNGDGIRDLVLANTPLGQVQLYAGNGDGTFHLASSIDAQVRSVLAGDLDGDRITDLVLSVNSFPSASAEIYRGTSTGLVKAGTYDACPSPGTLVLGDFNGDGKLDIGANCGLDFRVLSGQGAARFTALPPVTPTTPIRFGTITVAADLNGDGRDDLLTVSIDPRGNMQPAVLLGTANGSLGTPVILNMDFKPLSFLAADLDGDTVPELAFIDDADGALKIYSLLP